MAKRPDSRVTREGFEASLREASVRRRFKKSETHETAARVERICEMMRAGEWVRGQSDEALAAEWGFSASHIRNLSAEAWRRICAEANNPAEARPNIVATLLVSMERALGAGRFGDVARIADVWTRIIGAREPERTQEVPMTEEQARAKYRELTGQDWKGDGQ